MKNIFLSFLLFLILQRSTAQQRYAFDASNTTLDIRTGQLKMGDAGPAGMEIRVNNYFLSVGGKPIIPVMGEMHYSRIPREQWEDVILKMKACGINIIACYVIWIHHEEIEGRFEWSGDKDLKAFIALCKKHDLWVYPRIGPWSHAEVRNGGTPDWLLTKEGVKERRLNPVYQHYADEWYRQISLQLKGMLYKDGGPVIGVQLENEYGHGKAGEPYIMWLKQTALKYGIDAPMYTVTGWGNGSVPAYEVIPLWGAYPDEPWATTLTRTVDCQNFKFTPFRDDDKIGNDVRKAKESSIDYSAYPYFTCEMGVGIENTDHRRLLIGKDDGLGLVVAKLGSGSNLPGYYMFAGGSNPHGLLTTLEENKETGSYNTNPIVSYDFQAAIRETGELNESYFEIKKLHYFLNDFGDRLAITKPIFPIRAGNMQVAARASSNSAFLFGLNYCRHQVGTSQQGVQFEVKLKDETVIFPEKPMTIPDSAMFIWPVNFQMDEVLLKYGTVQPLCQLSYTGLRQWVFIQDVSTNPEMCFSDQNIKSLKTAAGDVEHSNGRYLIRNLKPGTACVIEIKTHQNVRHQVVILSKQEARQVWLFKNGQQKSLYLSNSGMYEVGDSLHLFGPDNHFFIKCLKPAYAISGMKDKAGPKNLFSSYDLDVEEQKPAISFKRMNPLEGAVWLKTSVPVLNDKNRLNHRFFMKAFSLDNPASIRAADITYFSDTKPDFVVNGLTVNQEKNAGQLNHLDLTGYLKKGNNTILISFPDEAGEKAFAANVAILYQNYNRTNFYSDTSWLTVENYMYPKITEYPGSFKFNKPQTIADRTLPDYQPETSNDYRFYISNYEHEKLSDAIVAVDYAGDKAMLYKPGILCADDFYNGSEWRISLNRIGVNNGHQLDVNITPLATDKKIFFDNLPLPEAVKMGVIHGVSLIPQYKLTLLLLSPKRANGMGRY